MANAWKIADALHLGTLGLVALAAAGVWAVGCGTAESGDRALPPPVETRELDASQTQRAMPPLD